MRSKLSLQLETIRPLELARVVGGAKKKKAPKPDDNGKADFMRMWHQIEEQQSGSYR